MGENLPHIITVDGQPNYLAGILMQCFDQQELCDFTIAAEGQEVKAHKFVLLYASKYLRDNVGPDQNYFNFANQLPFRHLQLALHFLYSGSISVERNELSSFFKSVQIMQFERLENAIDVLPGMRNTRLRPGDESADRSRDSTSNTK